MAYTFQVTFDCSEPHSLADWWAEALGWEVERSDESFIQSMIAQGFASHDDTTTHRGGLVWKAGAAIVHPAGSDAAPRVLFQLVPEPKTVKNRIHLDIRLGDDVEAVVEQWLSSGATLLHRGRQGPHTWVTLADPEGNELCLSR